MTQLGTMMPNKEREESNPSFESGRADRQRAFCVRGGAPLNANVRRHETVSEKGQG
jgi:hypothetical protein